MKENLFKFLFGDKPMPEQMPRFLFKGEWVSEAEVVSRRLATLIDSLIPSYCLEIGTSKRININSLAENLLWKHREVIYSILSERELEPLKSKDEFVRFLCHYLLEHEGDKKGGAR